MSTIQIIKTGITDITVDAIVNAANNMLLCSTRGVCRYIFEAAGRDALTAACQKIGHCNTGDSVITPGFRSKAKYIIHTVGPVWTDGKHGEPKNLYDCYYRSLILAKNNQCHSIAFPLISSGQCGYPKDRAWRKAVQACNDFVQDNPNYDITIYFAIPDDQLLALGKSIVAENWQTYAKKTDWKTYDMPKYCITFQFKRALCYEELVRLRYGFIPQSMDDKWFLYYEENKLYCHRSWTGFCIFIAEFLPEDTIKVTVNRDPKQYGRTSLFEDFKLFLCLVGKTSIEFYGVFPINIRIENNINIDIDGLDIGKGNYNYAIYFHKPEESNGIFSNWYPSKFELDGITFTSAEQYIMYRKSILFNDHEAAEEILKTDDPAIQQKIGRSVNSYIDQIWAGMRQLVLARALDAKFRQNKNLRDHLLATENAILVECAVSDRIWACGIDLYDNNRRDLSKWLGQNILGFTLMEIRDQLRKEFSKPSDYIADIHSHVLFGVDDGAQHCEMSLKMLRSMENQGVKHVFCTSHSSSHIELYNRSFAELQKSVLNAGIDITLHTGCEIYCCKENLDQVIAGLDNGIYPTLGNSQYALLEFPKEITAKEIIYCIKAILKSTAYQSERKSIIPVIAHAEQYLNLYRDEISYEFLSHFPLNIQINAYSLVEETNEEIRTLARKLLQDKLVTFIGSDCHRIDHRPPKLQSGISYIYETCDAEYAKDICYRNAEKLLNLQ